MLPIDNRIEVDPQNVLSRIGYADEYEPSGRIASLVNDYIENYHHMLAPAYAYRVRNIKSVKGRQIDLGEGIVLESGVLARLLKRCGLVAFFALTIGSYLEEMVAHLAEHRLVLQATVLDAIGSGAAENVANDVSSRIEEIAAMGGLVTSRRFSPGYCDWDVSQQDMVFKALGEDTAGVYLTKSHLMVPQKSVSGIIGIGLPGNEVEEYNPCLTCCRKDCPGRRK
jgi:hypothetical protein